MWRDGDDLPVVAGFQGGYHTEHVVRLGSELTPDDVTDALIRVALYDVGGAVLADGSWLFDETQWQRTSGGDHVASVPPVIFHDDPVLGTTVEVVGEAELVDGRTSDFSVTMKLVEVEP